jgi:hypothetical protein
VARDWKFEPTLQALEERLKRLAPHNTASVPLTITAEPGLNGAWVWTVDIHVRIPRTTEYEVTATGDTVAAAVRKAYLGLNNEALIRKRSDAANRQFGLSPA